MQNFENLALKLKARLPMEQYLQVRVMLNEDTYSTSGTLESVLPDAIVYLNLTHIFSRMMVPNKLLTSEKQLLWNTQNSGAKGYSLESK